MSTCPLLFSDKLEVFLCGLVTCCTKAPEVSSTHNRTQFYLLSVCLVPVAVFASPESNRRCVRCVSHSRRGTQIRDHSGFLRKSRRTVCTHTPMSMQPGVNKPFVQETGSSVGNKCLTPCTGCTLLLGHRFAVKRQRQ